MSYQILLSHINEIHDLRKAVRVLTWDREVTMPGGGDADRIHQITTLRRHCHSLYTSNLTGELIESATADINGAGYDSTQASLIRFLQRDYGRARNLPTEFISRSSEINSKATAAWKKAREENNFELFKPWLDKVVTLAQERAELLGYTNEPYDALIETYEPGTSTAEIRRLFEATKHDLVNLYQAIRQRRSAVNDQILRQSFNVDKQRRFAHYLASAVGYDFNRGHLATAVHPFSTSLSRNDVRITTRYHEDFLGPSIFATLHESGHAMYVQNVDPDLGRTPLAKETSAGLDESQSRMIENMVGRSQGFWIAHLPKLKELFPNQLGDVTVKQFCQAVNKVQPGYIRVEADELTYNLHIILRFELEQALLNNELKAADIPTAWNDKMQDLLGVRPPTDREGCLQDIHWTMVGLGYFPTYALGNLYAAQFFEAAQEQNPNISGELDKGNVGELMLWLKHNIHRHGRKFTSSEIVLRSTGKQLSHHAFVRYATEKYSRVYAL